VVAYDLAVREAVFLLAHELRSAGVATELDFMARTLKGQMKQAGKSRARYAVIVREEELASGTVTLKHMDTGAETPVPRNVVVATIVGEEEGRE